MKFLCENCKAKYQIADDKVAGRTVRMKCRKCGHLIEVESSVTETSTAAHAPQESAAKPSTGAAPGAAGPRPPVPPPRPGAGAALGASATGRLAPPPPRGTAGPASSAFVSGEAVTSVAPSAMVSAPPAPKTSMKGDAPGPPPGAAGLAGAFSKAFAAPKEDPSSVSAAMSVLSSSSTTEEWYVGINGVPVGPVRLSELRRKAASGLVTEESLVWREGFEEWVPLRTYPELCAMLKEAATGRTSYLPPPPNSGMSNRPAATRTGGAGLSAPAPAPSARIGAPPVRSAAPPATARSNVVALASRRATAEKIDGLEEPLIDTIHFESQPPPAPAPVIQHTAAQSPAGLTAPSVVFAEPASAPQRESFGPRLSARIRETRRAHPALSVVLVLGGVLVGAGIMSVLPVPVAKPTVQFVSVMVPAPPPPTPAEADTSTVVGPIEVAPAATGKPAVGGKPPKDPVAAGGAAAPLSTSLHGLGGLVGGPVAPNVAGPSTGGGGQLAAADVERVVQTHRAFVKRQCWDSALAGRGSGAPSSTRVSVQINVAPSGSVSSATATGGDGYPGLAACVQAQVTKWKFPPSDGSPVSVPFIFAAQ